ncbi:MAG: NAD(+)/NADH kinase [Candidatus Magnetoovum sp. WYHC-5]|nr:NAD(+)/NADH kinase [Candidatus Magnetoovum sp. WYHC-5]
MKHIGIITKPAKHEALVVLRELIPWLKWHGYDKIYLDKDAAAVLSSESAISPAFSPVFSIKGYEKEDIAALSQLIIVLGGDGTMLSVARLTAGLQTPILGINLGSLGFITEIHRHEIFDALLLVLSDQCPIEERVMLEAYVKRQGELVTKYVALNDVVINKGALARIFDTETLIDGRYVTTFKADGLIVATPTGSTAYSLSAGGPILYPTLRCMLITPICSHTLTNRPIVIEDSMSIEIVIKSESEDIYLTVDGQIGRNLCCEDIVEVKKAPFVARLYMPYTRDYFQVLREKLKWGER